MTNPTVFISYSHDSPEHVDRVLALADRLREDGIDCTLDQYETSPPASWPKWMDRHIAKSDFVIVICTETYYRRVMGEEEPGKGRGVKWESTLTYQHLYDADAENIRFIPVLFESGKVEHIPTPLQGATYYYVDTEQGYEDLYRRLTNQPCTIKPELGKLRKLPPRERKERERSKVLDAVPVIQEKTAEGSKLPQILLDFASAPSLQDWEVEGDIDCLTLEYDATLNKRVLMKKGREFDPGVTYKRQGAPPLDWSYLHYELAVRLHPESFIYINVLDKTGKNRTLLYSSAILPGLNQWEEFMIPLDKEVSDGNWHSLMIDLPEHMEQARWPSFVKVNWLRLRGAVTLAGIRGCDDKDPLIESAIASKYDVHFPILAVNDTLRPDSAPLSKDPATFVPYVIGNNRVDLVDPHVLLNAAESPQHGRELILWLSVKDPDKASVMIKEIGPGLLVSLSDSPQDVRVLFSALRDQSPSVGKLLASMITPQFETQMAKSPEDWGETQLILQRLRALEKVYDFFDHFVEADRSDYGKKKHCQIKFDKALVSGRVTKRGILQHPPLPEEGPSRLPYPPIPIPEHIQELRLDFFIGILDKWPDTGKQQPKFSKDPCKEDAVKFNVRINGKVELDERLNSVGWVPYSLPIELPTGGELTVEFITDAVSSATANWAAWGEPQLLGIRAVERASADSAITPGLLGTGNRWAVLVGVNEYEDKANYGQLRVCVKDVGAIYERLITGGLDPARVRLLTDDKSELPTRENILVALKSIADATEPDDLLLFYYSGHGDEDGGEGYLVARNGRRLVLRDTAVPISRVKEIMEQASARAKVIILDACHSGADIGGKGPKPMSAEFIRRVFQQAEGLAILSSCKQGQLSYEWRENECSVFTYFLLEAFTGKADRDEKGFVTVQDANRHVTGGVKLWASQRNLSQTPTLQYTVAGDIILIQHLPLREIGASDKRRDAPV
jgi:hypothetical protein